MKKKEALRNIIKDISNITDEIILIYPYIDIMDDGLRYGNKKIIRGDIEKLNVIRSTLPDILLDELDN